MAIQQKNYYTFVPSSVSFSNLKHLLMHKRQSRAVFPWTLYYHSQHLFPFTTVALSKDFFLLDGAFLNHCLLQLSGVFDLFQRTENQLRSNGIFEVGKDILPSLCLADGFNTSEKYQSKWISPGRVEKKPPSRWACSQSIYSRFTHKATCVGCWNGKGWRFWNVEIWT